MNNKMDSRDMAAAISRGRDSLWPPLDSALSKAETACFISRPKFPIRAASTTQAFDSAVLMLPDEGDGLVTPFTWRKDCGVPLTILSVDSTRFIAAEARRSLVALRAIGVAFCAAKVVDDGVLGSCFTVAGSGLTIFLRFDSGIGVSSSAGRGLFAACGVAWAGAVCFSGGSARMI